MNLSNLKEILEAREARAARQQELLLRGGVLISYSLNIPGPVKNSELYRIVFDVGLHKIRRAIELQGFAGEKNGPGPAEQTGSSAAGPYAFILFPEGMDGIFVKRSMTQIEETHELGRLWDMDVLIAGEDGPVKLSRSEIGYPKRKCLVCDAPAFSCVRASRHKVPEVLRHVVDRILSSEEVRMEIFAPGCKADRPACEPAENGFAERTAVEALRAILYEVITTPKPGLVDAENNGAHKDMNITTFFDSAVTIAPYFRDCVSEGIRRKNEEPERLLPYLRPLGLEAEKHMYDASGGVNTHKGAIFTMGVLCAAAGWRYARGAEENKKSEAGRGPEQCGQILSVAGRICSSMENGSRGIRKEAMNGYPSVAEAIKELDREMAAPVRDAIKQGEVQQNTAEQNPAKQDAAKQDAAKQNARGVRALLRLMSLVDDSNAVRRRGEQAAAEMKRKAEEIFRRSETDEEFLAEAARLDELLIRENLSPGGSADLLAAAYFLQGIRELP